MKTGNSCHQRFAKQTSSAVVTSDLFLVWHPGLYNKCHSVHDSFSNIPAGLQMEHILSVLRQVLGRKRDIFLWPLRRKEILKKEKKWDVKTIIGSYFEKYNQNISIYDLDLIYQTQQTWLCLTHFQTPRRELKIRRIAEYCWRTSGFFWKCGETSSRVFDISSQSKLKLRRKRQNNIVNIYAN